ncbi:MAG: extracellular solute-binding protein [Bacillota bacterium]|jgi:ABC-type glycerol-3-phosphate transport system substrate-binding protein|nr:extracellular solute-binding protein [Bacillota bacterium]
MKKIVLMVIAFLLIASLMTGCSGSTPSSQNGSPDSASAAGEKVKISFINGFTGGDGPFMNKIVDGFNTSQDKYEIVQLSTADHYVKFKSDDFDMLIIHADWISTYHGDGLLRELSDVYKAAGISLDDFHEVTKGYTTYDDGVFAVPLDLYADIMFYNKKLVPTPPKSYADLVALGKQLNSEESGIYPLAVPPSDQWMYYMFLTQNKVDFVEDGHLKLDTDEAADAFLALNKMIYHDKLSPANLGADADLSSFLKDGEGKNNIQAAVAFLGPWSYTAVKEKWGDDLGIAPLPVMGKELRAPAGGHNFAVSAKVKDQAKLDGIAAFLKYAYQPEVLSNWADAGQTPVHLKTMEYVSQNPDKYPVSAVTMSTFDKAEILPAIYNVREQVKYLNESVYDMVIQTPGLTKEQLMPELEKATKIAAELAEQ